MLMTSNGAKTATMLQPGTPAEMTIEMYPTSLVFRRGHRIRLDISSSNFPRFDRNLNSKVTPALGSAADAQKAVQQIFHDARHRSCLTLPVVKA